MNLHQLEPKQQRLSFHRNKAKLNTNKLRVLHGILKFPDFYNFELRTFLIDLSIYVV